MQRPVPHFVPCPRCSEPRLSHQVCKACGYYKDRLVVEQSEEESS
jgi:large subunit ribosomal protein L32